jgi:hypothetical protein
MRPPFPRKREPRVSDERLALDPRLREGDGEAFRSGRIMLSIGQAGSRGPIGIALRSPVSPVLSGRDQEIFPNVSNSKTGPLGVHRRRPRPYDAIMAIL